MVVQPLFAAAAAAATLLLAAAGPGPEAARLVYEVDAGVSGCPDSQALEAGVAARLGFQPFAPDAPRTVRVRVGRSGDGLAALVELLDVAGVVGGRRTLTSRGGDCRELASALELAVSLALDPTIALGLPRQPPVAAAPVAPEPPPVAPAAPVAPEPPPVAPAAPAEAASPLVLELGAGAHASLGAAPGPAAGGTVRVGLAGERLAASVEARVDLPASIDVPSGSVSAGLVAGLVAGCVRAGPMRACLLGGGGALRAAGHGLTDAKSVSLPWAGVGARVAAQAPLGAGLWAAAWLDGLAPLTRATLTDSATGVARWSSPALSAALGAGLLWRPE